MDLWVVILTIIVVLLRHVFCCCSKSRFFLRWARKSNGQGRESRLQEGKHLGRQEYIGTVTRLDSYRFKIIYTSFTRENTFSNRSIFIQ